MRRLLYTDFANRTRNVYILMAVTTSIAIIGIALSLSESDLATAFPLLVAALSWCYILFATVRNSAKHRSATSRLIECTDGIRHRILIERIVSLLILAVAAQGFVKALIAQLPLGLTLTMLWGVMVSGSDFVLVLITRLAADKRRTKSS